MNVKEAWERLESRYKQLDDDGALEELDAVRAALKEDKQQAIAEKRDAVQKAQDLERQILGFKQDLMPYLEGEGDDLERLRGAIGKIEASNRELASVQKERARLAAENEKLKASLEMKDHQYKIASASQLLNYKEVVLKSLFGEDKLDPAKLEITNGKVYYENNTLPDVIRDRDDLAPFLPSLEMERTNEKPVVGLTSGRSGTIAPTESRGGGAKRNPAADFLKNNYG